MIERLLREWTLPNRYCILLISEFVTITLENTTLKVMADIKKILFNFIMFIGILIALGYAADKKDAPQGKADSKAKSSIQKIIFEEQKIEGKIRRPQLVLIKADQRPNFPPMIMQSFGKTENVAEFVDQSIIDDMPNQGPFQFENNKISNYVP